MAVLAKALWCGWHLQLPIYLVVVTVRVVGAVGGTSARNVLALPHGLLTVIPLLLILLLLVLLLLLLKFL